MPDPIEYFLNSTTSIVLYQTIEISHPDFSQVFRLVRNNSSGLVATLEDASTASFDFLPMVIDKKDTTDDLDYGIDISFGDLGELLPKELDLIQIADSFDTKPVLIYRSFRSDDLSGPLEGPVTLEISKLAFNKRGAEIEAISPQANLHKTGLIYRLIDFPTIRGLL